jgi:hypothetical protein
MDRLIKTRLPTDTKGKEDVEILHTLRTLLESWKSSRSQLDAHWKECWANYFGTPNAQDWIRSNALKQTVGDIAVDWRHHISQGKAYDIVETAIPYFKSASFPNEDWFDLVPTYPLPDESGDTRTYLRGLKEFIKGKLDESRFKSIWEIFLRQLCITGTSCISMPWRTETRASTQTVLSDVGDKKDIPVTKVIKNSPDMAVEDMLDIWVDPDSDDPNRANMIRRFTLRRGELVRLVEQGVYPKANLSILKSINAFRRGRNSDRADIDSFSYGNTSSLSTDVIEVYEFWGNLELSSVEYYDVIVTWVGDVLLRVETSPYMGGRPFVFAQYTPIPETPYGYGMLSPVLGNLHELDTLSNCRLDGLDVTLQPTFLVVNDGTVDPNDVFVKPGRVIPVANPDSIRPLIVDNQFQSVSISEEQLREQLIERRTGTGTFVGTAPGRNGDRVTAAEVEAITSAGGNRLSGVYENIERQALLEIIQRCYNYCQQFQEFPEIVPVTGLDSAEILYLQIGAEQLIHNMSVTPIGSKHIADKEYNTRQLMSWLAAINSTPMIQQYINWMEVATELTRTFIHNNPDRFISEPQQQPEQNPNPMVDAAQQINGADLSRGIQTQQMVDGGAQQMAAIASTMPNQPTALTPQQQYAQQQPIQ